MSDTLYGVLIGFIVGVVTVSAVAHMPSSKMSIMHEMVKECEKTLPRDQHCKIIALPIDKD